MSHRERAEDGPANFSVAQRRMLQARIDAGGAVACPVCGVPLDRLDVAPRSDVSYVRTRVVLTCSRCHRWAALDRKPEL